MSLHYRKQNQIAPPNKARIQKKGNTATTWKVCQWFCALTFNLRDSCSLCEVSSIDIPARATVSTVLAAVQQDSRVTLALSQALIINGPAQWHQWRITRIHWASGGRHSALILPLLVIAVYFCAGEQIFSMLGPFLYFEYYRAAFWCILTNSMSAYFETFSTMLIQLYRPFCFLWCYSAVFMIAPVPFLQQHYLHLQKRGGKVVQTLICSHTALSHWQDWWIACCAKLTSQLHQFNNLSLISSRILYSTTQCLI